MVLQTLAALCLAWYGFITLVCAIGCFQLRRHYTRPSPTPVSSQLPLAAVPHVTVIRPVNGVEPFLYECLASTFLQAYPSSKLTFSFCLSTRRDPALRIVQRVLADFAAFDARIFIEEEDPNLAGKDGQEHNLGPNPKIRNMSRAYREAKGDIIWIIDCNVWIDKTVAGLMVDHLCGFSLASHGRKYKFVHQLPLVVDVSALPTLPIAAPLTGTASLPKLSESSRLLTEAASTYGSLLEELFLSTSHAKFYTAISTVAIAPCTVGKSNMFRRSHLDALTPPSLTTPARAPGIDFFSDNICEDHLIGDLLWKSPVPAAVLSAAIFEGHTPTADSPTPAPSRPALPNAQNWGNHALLFAPPCIQPLTLSLQSYAARRTRWLRVRKFTVPLATLVEPGTESLLATGYGAFGLTTLGRCQAVLGIPPTWGAFTLLWALGLLAWAACDYWVWRMLQGWAPGREGETKRAGGGGKATPAFVGSGRHKTACRWLSGWVGREVLAWPVWAWAVLGGTEVVWRGRRFWVGMDMRVHEVKGPRGKVQKAE